MEIDAGDPDCVTSIIDTGLSVSSSSTHAHIILLLQHVRKSVHVLAPDPIPENRVQLFRDVPDKKLFHIQYSMSKKTTKILPKDFFARQTTHDIPARESQRLNKLF